MDESSSSSSFSRGGGSRERTLNLQLILKSNSYEENEKGKEKEHDRELGFNIFDDDDCNDSDDLKLGVDFFDFPPPPRGGGYGGGYGLSFSHQIPIETNRQFFDSNAFGISTALFRSDYCETVRVSRNRILDSAAKVMEKYSSMSFVLEVEYIGEVGTGIGPTMEFYTLLSHEFQKEGMGMWRNGSGNGNLVQSLLGLFPRPWPLSVDSYEGSVFGKVVENFRLLGQVMARAIQDRRLLDLPFSTAFYELMVGQKLGLHNILSFDPELGKTLGELQALVHRKQYLESIGGDHPNAIGELCFRGTPIQDLCLDFTLPGYPDYILKPGDENVDINNLEEYITLVVDATLKSGIIPQMKAFRAGFNQVFNITSLQKFSPNELDSLLCGCRELWKPETLVDHIKFDHGYTAESPAIINLLEIMSEFTQEQQRAFCQFVTGAPNLRPGGLAMLNPKLTVVRKPSDDELPSVMTCVNYLKLPAYSTKEIMYRKLLYAIYEGQGSFDLS